MYLHLFTSTAGSLSAQCVVLSLNCEIFCWMIQCCVTSCKTVGNSHPVPGCKTATLKKTKNRFSRLIITYYAGQKYCRMFQDGSLMKFESIAECSSWSILQIFDLH